MTEKLKASVRAKVEHPLHASHHRNWRHRGLVKNTAQLFTLFAFANLMLVGTRFTVNETRRCGGGTARTIVRRVRMPFR